MRTLTLSHHCPSRFNRGRPRTIRIGSALRSVSVLTIVFGGVICHRWPCMLLNVRCTLFSNPTLSAILFTINELTEFQDPLSGSLFVFGMSDMQFWCAGLNRHEAENAKFLRERISDPLGPESCADTARDSVKRRQGYRRGGQLSCENIQPGRRRGQNARKAT